MAKKKLMKKMTGGPAVSDSTKTLSNGVKIISQPFNNRFTGRVDTSKVTIKKSPPLVKARKGGTKKGC
jgi:hypothetical protein